MSEFDDDFSGTDNNSSGPKALRDALDAEKAKNKDLTERLSKLEGAQRQSAVQSVITAKGLSPKVAKLIPSDVEPTEDAVTAWLEEYGDVFGASTPSAEGEGVDDSSAGTTVPEADQTALQAIQASAGSGVTPDAVTALQQKIKNATSSQEIAELMAEAGFSNVR